MDQARLGYAMSYLLRTAYQGLSFKPSFRQYHPTISLIIIIIQFALLLQDSLVVLTLTLVLVILESTINGLLKEQVQVTRGILPLMLFVGTILFLFSGIIDAIRIILRILIGAFIFSFFFSVTNPSDLTRSLESLKVPSKLAIIPALTMTLIPRVAKDADETIHALALRGELKGLPFFWMPRMLATFIASVLYRSELLSQSLYYRGFGSATRTHFKTPLMRRRDYLRLSVWMLMGILIVAIQFCQNGC